MNTNHAVEAEDVEFTEVPLVAAEVSPEAEEDMSELAQLAAFIRENNIQPRVIKSKSQAKRMTAADTTGHKYKVGERYYNVFAPKAGNAE